MEGAQNVRTVLSACLIVRDCARILSHCLENIRLWVDEMVVVDTGSVDDTAQVARRLDARVFHFPWCDDFSLARNESLRHARGDWLFWIDSDDIITPENGRKLRDLAKAPLDIAPMAYVMQVHCPVHRPGGQSGLTVVDHVKMFRNYRELRFEGRIHEQILPAIRRLNGQVAWTDIFVVHANSDQTPEGRKRKIERDLRLLKLDLKDRPDHPFVLFNLGMTYSDIDDHAAAVATLERCLELSTATESHVRKAYALLAGSLMQLKRHDEAGEVIRRGLALYPDDSELLFRSGILAHQDGRHIEAATCYRSAMADPVQRSFSSLDPSIRGYKARHNLALLYADMGRHDMAELQWREILRELPEYPPAWQGLGDSLLRQRRLATLDLELSKAPANSDLATLTESLRSKLLEYPAGNRYRAGGVCSLDSSGRTIRGSLCMIVRDSSRTLRAALESISPWVDEMVVVDTGSIDDTPRIAYSLGARVFHFPWCDDFSAARNESLRHARGDWILWMDSDDTIDPANGRRLRELVTRDHDPKILGFVMQVHCPGPSDDDREDVTVVDHVKVFRNHCGLQFEGRIHEQILPAINRAGGTVLWADIFVVHSGHDHSPAGQGRKRARDLRLLQLDLKERPDHPFTLFNLGMTYTDMERYEEAAEYLLKSIRLSRRNDSHLRKAYALLVYDYKMLKQLAEAWQFCEEGLGLFPDDSELRFRSGVLLHEMGRYSEAVQAYRQAMTSKESLHFGSYDIGVKGFKARHNLATTLTEMGDLAAAEVQWREITREKPTYVPAWRGLCEILVKQKKCQTALALADQLDGMSLFPAEGALLRSLVYESHGEVATACDELERALQREPSNRVALTRLCRLVFEHGEVAQAEAVLKRQLAVDPQDASARHNLGTVFLRMGRPADAAECYDQAIRLRPDFPDTWVYLGYAVEQMGAHDDAISCWNQALSISPDHPAASEAIQRVGGSRVASQPTVTAPTH